MTRPLVADRVLETTDVVGVGPATLLGRTIPYRSIFAAVGLNVQFYYEIEDEATGDDELGEGHLSDATTLVRDRPITTSNGNAFVSFTTGVKRVFIDAPAELINGDNASLATLTWGTPGGEVSSAIEVPATLSDCVGRPLASNQADVEVRVTDGAADAEPSATAILSAAGTPVGTVLAGSGTATLVIRTDNTGSLKVKVSETVVGFRYLWVRAAGHARLRVRSAAGVLELSFT